MHKVGDVLKDWKNQTYIILDTVSKKADYPFVTYELYCVQTKEYSYPSYRVVASQYESAY